MKLEFVGEAELVLVPLPLALPADDEEPGGVKTDEGPGRTTVLPEEGVVAELVDALAEPDAEELLPAVEDEDELTGAAMGNSELVPKTLAILLMSTA